MSSPLLSEMPARYQVHHLTTYFYSQPVSLSRHLLHLTPRDCEVQMLGSHRIDVLPQPAMRRAWQDSFGNTAVALAFEAPHDTLRVLAESVVTTQPRSISGDLGRLTVGDLRRWLAFRGGAPAAASAFLFSSPHVRFVAELDRWVERFLPDDAPVVAALDALTGAIHREFRYLPGATTVSTTVADLLNHRAGVCQDFAHFFIACVRRAGLAAAYVSGYLLTTPPPGQPRLCGADASHAWVAVPLPQDASGVQWLECDPTNGGRVDARYVMLARGRDFGDVSPLRGVILGGGEHRLEVQVTVSPEGEGLAQGSLLLTGSSALPEGAG